MTEQSLAPLAAGQRWAEAPAGRVVEVVAAEAGGAIRYRYADFGPAAYGLGESSFRRHFPHAVGG